MDSPIKQNNAWATELYSAFPGHETYLDRLLAPENPHIPNFIKIVRAVSEIPEINKCSVCGPGGTFQILKYGHMEKMVFTIMARDDYRDTFSGSTGALPIGKYALVQVELKGNPQTHDINVYVKIKRNEENHTKNAVQLNVRCGEFNKKLYCTDDWIRTEVKIIKADCSHQSMDCDCDTIRLFKVEIQFTERAMPCTSVVSHALYEDIEFTDFQLQATDGSVAMHKNVLYMHSEKLKEMLTGEWKEKTGCSIDINGVTVMTLQYLKDYMYLESLPDSTDELELLLIIAVRYSIDKMKADCIRKIIELIRPGQMDKLINIAWQNNIPELVTALVFDVPDNLKFADRHLQRYQQMGEDCSSKQSTTGTVTDSDNSG